MNKIPILVIFTVALLASCAGRPAKRVLTFSEMPDAARTPGLSVITDYRDKANGGTIPEWVELWLDSGVHEVEALEAYQNRYVFVAKNEGNNFNALSQWLKGFSADLDFPRLAAARIEARFGAGVPFPDDEYGTFYETIIRGASDTLWNGAVREDDFWIRQKRLVIRDEEGAPSELNPEEGQGDASAGNLSADSPYDEETWEFLILVTIEKNLFASQLNGLFKSVNPSPPPSKDQISAVNRVKDHFFEGF